MEHEFKKNLSKLINKIAMPTFYTAIIATSALALEQLNLLDYINALLSNKHAQIILIGSAVGIATLNLSRTMFRYLERKPINDDDDDDSEEKQNTIIQPRPVDPRKILTPSHRIIQFKKTNAEKGQEKSGPPRKQDENYEIEIHFSQIRSRISNEIIALSKRGNISLFIGVASTIVATSILATTVASTSYTTNLSEISAKIATSQIIFKTEPYNSDSVRKIVGLEESEDSLDKSIEKNIETSDKLFKLAEEIEPIQAKQAAIHFIPRFSLSLFIEVFSFFFLKIYSNSLEDIKYYQNELRNL